MTNNYPVSGEQPPESLYPSARDGPGLATQPAIVRLTMNSKFEGIRVHSVVSFSMPAYASAKSRVTFPGQGKCCSPILLTGITPELEFV